MERTFENIVKHHIAAVFSFSKNYLFWATHDKYANETETPF